MLTYEKFKDYNKNSQVEIKIYENCIEIIKPKNCQIKEIDHNFDECININSLESIILNLITPRKIEYKVQIRYREIRKTGWFDWGKEKKLQYIILTNDGDLIDEGDLEEIDKIQSEKNIIDKIVELLKSIELKNIKKCFLTKETEQPLLIPMKGE